MKRTALITGIGSLPHHNVDSAIEYSFRHDIPFLPQLPIYNPNEYMIYQSLHNMPGILKPENGIVLLDLKKWLKNRNDFSEKYKEAKYKNDFSCFLPSIESMSAWNAFLFELEERDLNNAKIQLAGPFTCVQMLKLSDHEAITSYPDIISDILICVEAQARAMVQALKERNVNPILFIDEPGLMVLSPQNTLSLRLLGVLKKLILNLKSNSLKIGIHCCSNTLWNKVFELQADYVSFDTNISWHKIIDNPESLVQFYKSGGKLSLGIVSTNHESSNAYQSIAPHFTNKLNALQISSTHELLTAACGLAYKSIDDCESILAALKKEKSQWY